MCLVYCPCYRYCHCYCDWFCCLIVFNHDLDVLPGAAIQIDAYTSSTNVTLDVVGGTQENNYADRSGGAFAAYFYGTGTETSGVSARVRNVRFNNNSAVTQGESTQRHLQVHFLPYSSSCICTLTSVIIAPLP